MKLYNDIHHEEVQDYLEHIDKVQKRYRDQAYDAESEDRLEREHFKRKDRRRKYKWNQQVINE